MFGDKTTSFFVKAVMSIVMFKKTEVPCQKDRLFSFEWLLIKNEIL